MHQSPNRANKATNITWHDGKVGLRERTDLLGQRGCVVWITGLSGSGKSTIARQLEASLLASGHLCYVLDGDNIRHGLNSDLGFSPEDRTENIRRIGEVAALMADAGIITLVAFISPYRQGRQQAREAAGAERFVEVFCDTPLDVCQQRDPKGLYSKAISGEITEFTGISAPYEAPESPQVVVPTQDLTPQQAAMKIEAYLKQHSFLLEEQNNRS